MTTQSHVTETAGSTGERDRYASDPQRTKLPPDPLATPIQPDERDEQLIEATAPATASRADESMFDALDLTGLRPRWDAVQASFVDDPRTCVQAADGLVSEVVQQLVTRSSRARAHLEDQWARGENVSTEDLRQALKRYREFFDRLLAV